MKSQLQLVALSSILSQVLAFPALQKEALQRLNINGKDYSVDELPPVLVAERTRRAKRANTFDAKAQYVSTHGEHKWVAPNFAAGDQRGPCPGLNALANHGYIPHNGVASATDLIAAVNNAYGMSLDLGGFLAVYGTVFDGNPLSLDPGYSIGGPSKLSQNILGNIGGLLGNPTGLSGSHNKYESDASPTRGDLYMFGNDYHVQVPYFQQYYDALVEGIPAPDQYSNLLEFRINRFNTSVYENPYFFYSPFAGIVVSPAGYSFPPAMMSNHSEEFPDGMLSRENLMSFFAITGESGNFKYSVGHERIPDNWYRRPETDQYSIAGFLADVLEAGIQYPPFLDVTGNTGTPNSLVLVDLANLTEGVFETGTLAKGNNLECFALQAIMAGGPDLLDGLFTNPVTAMSPLTSRIGSILAGAACPQLTSIDESQYQKYPGVRKSHGAM